MVLPVPVGSQVGAGNLDPQDGFLFLYSDFAEGCQGNYEISKTRNL
jgi:hypothetical protein